MLYALLQEHESHVSGLKAQLDAARDRLFDLLWLDRCPSLAPLRGGAAFAEARALVEARAAEVRSALTRPLD